MRNLWQSQVSVRLKNTQESSGYQEFSRTIWSLLEEALALPRQEDRRPSRLPEMGPGWSAAKSHRIFVRTAHYQAFRQIVGWRKELAKIWEMKQGHKKKENIKYVKRNVQRDWSGKVTNSLRVTEKQNQSSLASTVGCPQSHAAPVLISVAMSHWGFWCEGGSVPLIKLWPSGFFPFQEYSWLSFLYSVDLNIVHIELEDIGTWLKSQAFNN